jgi:hypothetical protein
MGRVDESTSPNSTRQRDRDTGKDAKRWARDMERVARMGGKP